MKLKYFVPAMLVGGALIGCEEEDKTDPVENGPVDVVVSIEHGWQEETFNLNSNYLNINEYPVTFSGLTYYLSEMYLVDENGNTQPLAGIVLVRGNESLPQFELTGVETRFTAVGMSIGVPVEMNGTDNPDFNPGQYPNNHPLSVSQGTYWAWASGYRFIQLDGFFETDPALIDTELNEPFSMHPGLDTCFRSVEIPIDFVPTPSGNRLVLRLNVDQLFTNGTDTLDLAVENTWHGSLSNVQTGLKVSDFFRDAWTAEVR